jgi:hypothetical protein
MNKPAPTNGFDDAVHNTGPTVPVKDARVEPETPLPAPPRMPSPPVRRASGEVEAVKALVRESQAPKEAWAKALEDHAKELRTELMRTSQENLDKFRVVDGELTEHESRADEHEARLKRIESNSGASAVSSGAAAASSSEVVKLFSGFLPPKLVMGIAALGALVQAIIQAVQLLRGH